MFTKVPTSSIILASAELKNVLGESVGDRKQGHYVSCCPMSKHNFTIPRNKRGIHVPSLQHKLTCHHDCTKQHCNVCYRCGLAIVKPRKIFKKSLPMANPQKFLSMKISRHTVLPLLKFEHITSIKCIYSPNHFSSANLAGTVNSGCSATLPLQQLK